jgi:hypothetical protein
MPDAFINIEYAYQLDPSTVRVGIKIIEDVAASEPYEFQIDILDNGATLGSEVFSWEVNGTRADPVDIDTDRIEQDVTADVFASMYSPAVESAESTVSLEGQPVSFSVDDAIVQTDYVEAILSASGIAESETARVNVALNFPTELVTDKEFTTTGSFSQRSVVFDDIGVPEGDEWELRVDSNLLEPVAAFDTTTVVVPGPDSGGGGSGGGGNGGGGGTGGGGGGSDQEFSADRVSVSCGGVSGEFSPGQIFDIDVEVTNENPMAAVGNIEVVIDGEVAGVASDVVVNGGETATIPGQAIAPSDPGEFGVSARKQRWREAASNRSPIAARAVREAFQR